MLVVFQGETGGELSFPYGAIPATSGYIFLVDQYRRMVRVDGTLSAGSIHIDKAYISNLKAGDYVVLPQVIDANNDVYFLADQSLLVQEVPDFFDYALLTPADSLLVRLENLEGQSLGYTAFPAGENIQAGKIVCAVSGQVYQADARNINHINRSIGVSIESASVGASVKVQLDGRFHAPNPYMGLGPVFVGYAGTPSTVIQNDFVFIQPVGVITATYDIVVDIDKAIKL